MQPCYVLVDPDGSSGYWYRTMDEISPTVKRVVVWSNFDSKQRLQSVIPHNISPDLEVIYDCNTVDLLLRNFEVKTVLPGCDNSIWLVEELQRALTPLLANSKDTSCYRRTKLSVYKRLHEVGLLEPVQLVTDQKYDHVRISEPSVIKPIDGRGGNNVAYINTHEDMLQYLALPFVQGRQFIVQKRYIGAEYAVDMVSREGKHVLTAIWKYDIPSHTHVVDEVTLIDPVKECNLVYQLTEYVRQVLTCLGYDNGPSHTEIMVCSDGNLRLIEVNFRLHGHLDEKAVQNSLIRNQIVMSIDSSKIDRSWIDDHTFGFKRPLKKFFINNIEPKYIKSINWLDITDHIFVNLQSVYSHSHLYPGYRNRTTYLGDSLGVIVMVGRVMSRWNDHIDRVRQWKSFIANAKDITK